MNSYEMNARSAKVSRLLDTLIEAQVTAEVAKTLDSTDWGSISTLAKVNPPSFTTIGIVIERLSQLESMAAKKGHAA